jgi:hypothetical protein
MTELTLEIVQQYLSLLKQQPVTVLNLTPLGQEGQIRDD